MHADAGVATSQGAALAKSVGEGWCSNAKSGAGNRECAHQVAGGRSAEQSERLEAKARRVVGSGRPPQSRPKRVCRRQRGAQARMCRRCPSTGGGPLELAANRRACSEVGGSRLGPNPVRWQARGNATPGALGRAPARRRVRACGRRQPAKSSAQVWRGTATIRAAPPGGASKSDVVVGHSSGALAWGA